MALDRFGPNDQMRDTQCLVLEMSELRHQFTLETRLIHVVLATMIKQLNFTTTSVLQFEIKFKPGTVDRIFHQCTIDIGRIRIRWRGCLRNVLKIDD